jgi:hypothetical protein
MSKDGSVWGVDRDRILLKQPVQRAGDALCVLAI